MELLLALREFLEIVAGQTGMLETKPTTYKVKPTAYKNTPTRNYSLHKYTHNKYSLQEYTYKKLQPTRKQLTKTNDPQSPK